MPSHQRKKPTSEAAIAVAEAAVQDNKTALREADERRAVASWLTSSLKSTSKPSSSHDGTSDKPPANGSGLNGSSTLRPLAENQDDHTRREEDSDASSTFSLDLNEDGGLGFSDPLSSISNLNGLNVNDRANAAANDKLRSQLLGSVAAKNFKSMQRARINGHGGGNVYAVNGGGLVASKPMPSSGRGAGFKKGSGAGGKGEDSDEEEGRTGITGSRSRIKGHTGVLESSCRNDGVAIVEEMDDDARVDGGGNEQPHDSDTSTTSANVTAASIPLPLPPPPPSLSSAKKLNKRPLSYMDELLAKRNKKKKK